MTKRQAMRYRNLMVYLTTLGMTVDEGDTLLRCSRTLSRWAERECGDGSNWAIERDEDTGKPFSVYHGPGKATRYPIADREAGALRRATAIAEAHGLTVYHQGDCRGCALYVIRPGDVPEGSTVESCYSRGVAICID